MNPNANKHTRAIYIFPVYSQPQIVSVMCFAVLYTHSVKGELVPPFRVHTFTSLSSFWGRDTSLVVCVRCFALKFPLMELYEYSSLGPFTPNYMAMKNVALLFHVGNVYNCMISIKGTAFIILSISSAFWWTQELFIYNKDYSSRANTHTYIHTHTQKKKIRVRSVQLHTTA